MYKGWKLLTKEDRRHLRIDGNIYTTYDLERTFKEQAKMRALGGEPCWTCKRIAEKLGYAI